FYMPNQTIWDISQKYPEIFTPTISVHPYRQDAIQELEKWAKLGVKFIKWLPNSMRIDPSRPQLDAYYDKVKELDMTILTHVGEERAVEGDQFQKLGNPLLYRKPLDKGVKIIMAHVASLGNCEDFEQGGQKSCFQLFWRLFNEDKYKGILFGEISAVTIHTRLGEALLTILEHPELQTRLMNGSDYPLPAINWIYRTSQWKDQGYITDSERESLNQIYHYNPLLFDFVSKRTLHHPKTGMQLRPEIFYLPKVLGGCLY
ncbi:MAG: amidohydrolase, partial [Bdellovibrionota bacterium]